MTREIFNLLSLLLEVVFLAWALGALLFLVETFVVPSEWRWYRRRMGGHWERWYVDHVHADLWHWVDVCSKETGTRPHCACRGTPVCEDWPEKGGDRG